ncbi:hypothetical protein GCM10023335_50990 [Streptomyces siamensis]|uniref:Type 1 glutamine amidotransferase domain-containing protein n=1 Tax=Streptomyces siamensis TaxID=1274986 RepID=A0ABP9J749_9ACTN
MPEPSPQKEEMEMTKALFVVSAADRWTLNDGTAHPSGFWGEELAMPHKIFTEAGWEITIATPGGKAPTLDRLSMSRTAGLPSKLREVSRYLDSIRSELNSPRELAKTDPDDFDVVFYPGGHGPMEDLAVDPVSGALLSRVLRSGKPLALSVQHRGEAQQLRPQGSVASGGPSARGRSGLRQGTSAAVPVRGRRPEPVHRPEPRVLRTARQAARGGSDQDGTPNALTRLPRHLVGGSAAGHGGKVPSPTLDR